MALVGELVERLGVLEAELAALREENADLRRQLGRHSGQPPSQDGPQAPPRCGGCGAALPRVAAGAPAVRQVHDLPEPPPLFVTEHRAHAVRCPGCGTRTRAAFPEGVDGPVRFGPRRAVADRGR